MGKKKTSLGEDVIDDMLEAYTTETVGNQLCIGALSPGLQQSARTATTIKSLRHIGKSSKEIKKIMKDIL